MECPSQRGLKCLPQFWALMQCTLPLSSAVCGGWSCTTTCMPHLQAPCRRDALPVGAIPRARHASIHPCRAEIGQHSVRRLLGAQRSPLVLTHHSEAFWGNAGLKRIPPPRHSGREASVQQGTPELSPGSCTAAGPTPGQHCNGVPAFGTWIWLPAARCPSIHWNLPSLVSHG